MGHPLWGNQPEELFLLLQRSKLAFIKIGISILIFLYILACGNKKQEEYQVPITSNLSGKELAQKHCASCHLYPEPSQLPKSVWVNSVLPKMALRFGHGDFFGEMTAMENDEMLKIITMGIYPEKPIISKEDWEKIVSFYDQNSPDSLRNSKIAVEVPELNRKFKIVKTEFQSERIVQTNWDSGNRKIWISDAKSKKLNQFDFLKKSSNQIESVFPIVEVANHKIYGLVGLNIGNMNPTDQELGSLKKLDGELLIANLKRPVHLNLADLNQDGVEDFLIANFGNHSGDFSWYDGKSFEKHNLINQPGARVSYYLDFDGDGRKDILVLMTQAKEQIVWFKNKGKGDFEYNNLLEFPPQYGSSFFQFLDFNKDGFNDIIYTNGDNADLSTVFKDYHGVRIFLNDGKNNFKQSYFYPINGASKVVSKDFDNDGKLDFVVSSYFPKKNKNESLLIFYQTTEMSFKPTYIENISETPWLTMDVGDIDNNGSEDIVLGGFLKSQSKTGKGVFILLNNKLK